MRVRVRVRVHVCACVCACLWDDPPRLLYSCRRARCILTSKCLQHVGAQLSSKRPRKSMGMRRTSHRKMACHYCQLRTSSGRSGPLLARRRVFIEPTRCQPFLDHNLAPLCVRRDIAMLGLIFRSVSGQAHADVAALFDPAPPTERHHRTRRAANQHDRQLQEDRPLPCPQVQWLGVMPRLVSKNP